MELNISLIAKLSNKTSKYGDMLQCVMREGGFYLSSVELYLRYRTGIYWPRVRNDYSDPDAVSASEALFKIQKEQRLTDHALLDRIGNFRRRFAECQEKFLVDIKLLETEFGKEACFIQATLRAELARLTWMAREASTLQSTKSLPKESEIMYAAHLTQLKISQMWINFRVIIDKLPQSEQAKRREWTAKYSAIQDQEQRTVCALESKLNWPYTVEAVQSKSKICQMFEDLFREMRNE